uniref:Uncharacterized protein n=1 Tax=Chlamydia pneumoniae TaxID=83558 RepID=A0A0F7X1B6_CHLPN|nr:hypothetical protein BN1224_DC9_BD_00180 [Chlamydia pneumoniae]
MFCDLNKEIFTDFFENKWKNESFLDVESLERRLRFHLLRWLHESLSSLVACDVDYV